MKTRIITLALAAMATFAWSCSKEMPDGNGAPSDGNRVEFTLGGSTRAAGDNDTHSTLAATDNEKKIDNLIAVTFTEDGNYYKTFDAGYDADSQTASFDIEKNGTYDIWFVANADETLSEALFALTDQNANSQVTADDLLALLVSQQVGKQDGVEAWHPFLMLSTEAKRIVSKHGVTTDGGLVLMRRLAVRIDLVNAADGVTINSVSFINRTKQSRLGASNDMNFSTPDALYETKTYDGLSLTGNFEAPVELKETIYSYENVETEAEGEHLPAIEIKYTLDGLKFTHTVEFFDSTDPSGAKHLALKRNYLYRIVLTRQLDLTFDIIVDDWDKAEAFQVNDLPFEEHDQAALNAKLKVNMFTPYNVLSLNKDTKEVTFYEKLATSREECPTTSYFTYGWLAGQADGTYSSNGANTDTDLRNAILTDAEGNKYRIPTMGELMLLAPTQTPEAERPYVDENGKWLKDPDGKGNGNFYPNWPGGSSWEFRIPTIDRDGNDYAFTETLYLTNDESFASNKAGETITGTSYLRQGKFVRTITYQQPDASMVTYYVYPVYALRFKGTSEFAAYKYEYFEDNGLNYISIKIKALPADSPLTIDDITDNASFWNSGYLEFKFAGSGYYLNGHKPAEMPEEDNTTFRNLNCYMWSSTRTVDTIETDNYFGFGVADIGCFINRKDAMGSLQLRLVKVSE